MKALLYLNIHLLKNTILNALKNPKVAVPGLFLITLFAFPLFFLYTIEMPPLEFPYTTDTVKPMIFSFFTFITWATVIHSTTKNTLIFSLPEIDFLFPSPLKRETILLNRMLVNYLKTAFQYLGMAGILLLVLSSIFTFPFWPRILFLWLAIVLIMIFASNLGDLISLASSHRSELNRSRNRKVLIGLAALFLLLIAGHVYRYTLEGTPLVEAFTRALNSTVVRVIMFPMAAASDVAVAWKVTPTVGIYLVILVGLSILTTWGVLSVETHFYEASEATSRKIWESVQKMRRQEVVVSESFVKKMGRLQNVTPFGNRSTALIWKNLVGILRDIRTLVPTFVMASIFFVIMVARGGEFYSALFLLLFLVFITSGYIRWDFREDLRRIEIIKLIPDSNFKIVISEITIPTLVSSIISYLFLVVTVVIFPESRSNLSLIGFVVCAIPLFALIMVTILNLVALYYPPQTSNQAIPGIISMIGMMVAVGPSVLLGMLFVVMGRLSMGLVVVLIVNGGIALALLGLLARKFRGFDLTAT